MGRFQELVNEREKLRQDIAVLQDRLRDLRIRQATLDCALEFAVPDSPRTSRWQGQETRPALKKAA